ncbi:thymidine kinase, partial [Candidatus Uhrbacteria bacterium]|nr:thymidine kinase [Candidatus Uhrbacteria bacterium]
MLGSLTFFTGPMACGKTLELVRHLQIHSEQRIPTVCIRPATDTRTENVESRAGLRFDGLTVQDADLETIKGILDRYEVVGVDEAHFFPPSIVPLLADAMRRGKTILVAGLDADFRGDTFPTALALLSLPETSVQRTPAVCCVCRKHNATRTQRLKDGQPARRDDPTVMIEGEDVVITYEPRCLEHHVIL